MKQKFCSILFVSLCFILTLPFRTLAQQSQSISLFKRDAIQESRWNALRSNQRVSIIEYNLNSFLQLKSNVYPSIDIEIPTPNETIRVKLKRNELFSDDFTLRTDKEKNIPFTPGLHYHGEIEGQPESTVAISFFEHEVAAVFHTQQGAQYSIGESSNFRRGSFVVYDASNAEAPAIDCLAETLPDYHRKAEEVIKKQNLEQRALAGCVNIYFELGNSVYNNKGGTNGAANYISSVFNVVSTLFAKEGITVKISDIFVWTSLEPYSTSASTALTDFGRTRQRNFNGDIAQFVRLKTGGSLSGIAWLNVLCYPYLAQQSAGPYSYAEVIPSFNNFPAYSWTTQVITHELGHNLGSPHTQSCTWEGGPIDNCVAPEGSCAPGPAPINGGTIMSYCHHTSIGVNFNNGFGPKPSALINNRVNAATCLVVCGSGTTPCAAPTGLSTNSITNSSAIVSWQGVAGANSYTLNYKTNATTTWTTATAATTAISFTLSGLISSTVYQWQVRSNCNAGSSTYAAGSFSTTANTPVGCQPPVGLSVSNLSPTTTTLNWQSIAGATSYRIQYKLSTATTWTTASISTTITSIALSGLSAGTLYQWQVASNCGTSISTYVSGQFTTTTQTACAAPLSLTASNISNTTATWSWSAVSNAFNYTIEYKLLSAINWTALTITSGIFINVTGLISASTYQWRVKTNCSTATSGFTQSQFTTAGGPTFATCNAPIGLSVSNISSNSVNLGWSAVTNVVSYQIEYKLSSSTTWVLLNAAHSTTAYSLLNLNSNSTYDWRVKTNCVTGSSGYTVSQFSTSTVSTLCPGNFDAVPNEGLSTAPTVPLNSNILGRINTTTDHDYYKFIVTIGGSLTISVGTLPADYDLRIYNSNGISIGLSQNSGTSSEIINTNLSSGTYFVRIYGWAGANNSALCYTLRIQTGTAQIEHYEQITSTSKLSSILFPNPVKTILQYEISDLKGPVQVTVIDLQGRALITSKTKTAINQLNVSDLTTGFYLLKTEDEYKRVSVQKFMKAL